MGACSWALGSELCTACAAPWTRLCGPHREEALTISERPVTLDELCSDARSGDADAIRWFWGVYGRESRARLESALTTLTALAA